MQTDLPIDGVDSRLVLRLYAGMVTALGLFIFLWGPMWVSEPGMLNGQPFGLYALIRISGAILMWAGLSAVGLALIEDPVDRRRALGWFTVGHFVVLFVGLFQQQVIWGTPPNFWLWFVATAMGVGLFYSWQRADGDRPPFSSVVSDVFTLFSAFGDRRTSPALPRRSQYEQQIRLAAAQEERNRLARDLHDSIKQQIFVIQTASATAETRFDDDAAGARHALETVRAGAREAMAELEAMTDQLRAAPLTNAGLVEALKKQSEALGFRTGADVEFSVGTLPSNEALAPGAQQAIFRVAQEALANVARHARATHVAVSLGARASDLVLEVTDDGAGYDSSRSSSGMGIANMRARAEECGGRLDIGRRAGGGTAVRFRVPFLSAPAVNFPMRILFNCSLAVASGLLMAWQERWQGSGLTVVLLISMFETIRYSAAWYRARQLQPKTS